VSWQADDAAAAQSKAAALAAAAHTKVAILEARTASLQGSVAKAEEALVLALRTRTAEAQVRERSRREITTM
jgi:hypothetical protein